MACRCPKSTKRTCNLRVTTWAIVPCGAKRLGTYLPTIVSSRTADAGGLPRPLSELAWRAHTWRDGTDSICVYFAIVSGWTLSREWIGNALTFGVSCGGQVGLAGRRSWVLLQWRRAVVSSSAWAAGCGKAWYSTVISCSARRAIRLSSGPCDGQVRTNWASQPSSNSFRTVMSFGAQIACRAIFRARSHSCSCTIETSLALARRIDSSRHRNRTVSTCSAGDWGPTPCRAVVPCAAVIP